MLDKLKLAAILFILGAAFLGIEVIGLLYFLSGVGGGGSP